MFSLLSAVREIFSKVERLDGMDLPKKIGFEVEDEVDLPPTLPSSFCSEDLKAMVIQFIEQYYQAFESDRRRLEEAYTEDALLSISANMPETAFGSMYSKWIDLLNRNLKRLNNSDKKVSLLHSGRASVTEALCRLPKLMHDPHSFVIDIPIVKPCLMHVVLTGIFKQDVDKNPPFRNFMKSMVIVPVGSGFCISNEEFYINSASGEQIKKAFKEPAIPALSPEAAARLQGVSSSPDPVPSASAESVLLPAQIELIKQFAIDSKMLPEYCQMCLERNNWEYNKAGEMFLALQNEGKIPPNYFGVIT